MTPSSDQGGIRHYDKEGKPLELMEWARLFESFEYRRIAETRVGEKIVRTMWEGTHDGVRGACMWSTGVWNESTGWESVWEGYYPCTRIEAEAAHEMTVAELKAKERR